MSGTIGETTSRCNFFLWFVEGDRDDDEEGEAVGDLVTLS
jgi:hypothetical protein